MIDLTQYRRRATHEVRIGACTIGGTHPVAVQSMTNTDTNDTALMMLCDFFEKR